MTIERLIKSILTLDEKYAKETKVMKTQESLKIQTKLMQKGVELYNTIVSDDALLHSMDEESRRLLAAIQNSAIALNTKDTTRMKEMSLADGIEHWDTIHFASVAIAMKLKQNLG